MTEAGRRAGGARRSRSSASRTSASPPSSTGSPAAGRRSSTREAGVTRDRKALACEWNGVGFELIDTGGVDLAADDSLSRAVQHQAREAIADADAILLVVDARAGLRAGRRRGRRRSCRRSDLPVVVVANKVDRPEDEPLAAELHALGARRAVARLGHPRPRHRRPARPDRRACPRRSRGVRAAGTTTTTSSGSPSSGARTSASPRWSTLPRHRAGDRLRAGRDDPRRDRHRARARRARGSSSSTPRGCGGAPRLRGRSTTTPSSAPSGPPSAPTSRSSSATRPRASPPRTCGSPSWRCEAAARRWSRSTSGTSARPTSRTRRRGSSKRLRLRPPVITSSAMRGPQRPEAAREALELADRRAERIPTPELNRFVAEVVASTPPPSKRGRRLRLLYAAQVGRRPPRIAIQVNDRGLITRDWAYHLENRLRERYGLEGVPLVIDFVPRSGRRGGPARRTGARQRGGPQCAGARLDDSPRPSPSASAAPATCSRRRLRASAASRAPLARGASRFWRRSRPERAAPASRRRSAAAVALRRDRRGRGPGGCRAGFLVATRARRDDDAAELVPADALAYLHVDLDPDSEQYQQAATIAARVPLISRQVVARALGGLIPARTGRRPTSTATSGPGSAARRRSRSCPGGRGARAACSCSRPPTTSGAAPSPTELAAGRSAATSTRDRGSAPTRPGLASAVVGGFLVIGTADGVRGGRSTSRHGDGDSLAGRPRGRRCDPTSSPTTRLAEAYVSPHGIARPDRRSARPLVVAGAVRRLRLEPRRGRGARRRATTASRSRSAARSTPSGPRGIAGVLLRLPALRAELPGRSPAEALAYVGSATRRTRRGAARPGERRGARARCRALETCSTALRSLGRRRPSSGAAARARRRGRAGAAVRPGRGRRARGRRAGDDAGARSLELDRRRASTRSAPARRWPRLQGPIAEALATPVASRRRSSSRSEVAGVEAQSLRISPTVNLTYAASTTEAGRRDRPGRGRAGRERRRRARRGRRASSGPPTGFPDECRSLAYLNLADLLALGEREGLAEDPAYATFAEELRKLEALGLAVTSGEDELATDAAPGDRRATPAAARGGGDRVAASRKFGPIAGATFTAMDELQGHSSDDATCSPRSRSPRDIPTRSATRSPTASSTRCWPTTPTAGSPARPGQHRAGAWSRARSRPRPTSTSRGSPRETIAPDRLRPRRSTASTRKTCAVITAIDEQSPDIAQGVDTRATRRAPTPTTTTSSTSPAPATRG